MAASRAARRCRLRADDPDAAFAVLVTQSQNQNRKLRDVASELARIQDRHPTSG